MVFATLRRRGAPVALVSCAAFLAGLAPPRAARAATAADEQPEEAEHTVEPVKEAEPLKQPSKEIPNEAEKAVVSNAALQHALEQGVPASAGAAAPSTGKDVDIGASGGDKTGVSTQAISLPQGAGKIQGMGESFSAQLSTGIATFTVPIQLLPARGSADPGLSLSYSSSGGHGIAGVGWEVGWASISRQTDRGIPSYVDGATWQPNQDRFVFGSGQELVPICTVTAGACPGAIAGEVMPAWADGWQYFRSRVEGSYERFFWAPNHQTWRVQSKSGVQMELGVPLDGSGYAGALEEDTGGSGHIFKWNVVRQYDAYGTTGTANPVPANPVVYRYLEENGLAYLSDIYDTPPASSSTAALSAFAHHTHLRYAVRPDATQSYRRGWLTTQAERLVGIDITSKPFTNAAGSPLELVRRYHLSYDPSYHVSLLTSVQLEGQCAPNALESATGILPTTSCPTLPAMTFDYQHVTPYNGDGTPGVADLVGYEGFDDRTISMTNSPGHSVDEALADMFDLNADSLPDMLVTMPGLYNGNDGAYFNGTSGIVGSFTAGTVPVLGVLGATSGDITLSNPNILACDIDGDGTIDFLHQPAVKSYAIYAPAVQPGGSYALVGRAIPQSALQSPLLDLGNDTPNINVMDVNGDGLVDVVIASGTEMQTFYSLGRYPNGDGNFGSATWAGPYSSNLSLAPVTSCVPWDGVPVQFSDPTIQIADMNGDGLPDIVRVQQGNVHYWPGRGNGVWGTGSTSTCQAQNFSEGTFVAMENGPELADPSATDVQIADINGDGLDDILEITFSTVNIWLNVDGVGFTPGPHVTTGFTPASGPEWLSKVRIVDMNGSGLRDIFWGEGGNFRYIDVASGERPWVLTRVANGLGKTTDLTYSTSAVLMQAAAAAGTPWTSMTPLPVHVVTQVVDHDNLGTVGRPAGTYTTQYSYANPVYDGRQREFRGFQEATSTKLGDANGPTSTTSSTFLLGQCVDDEQPPPGVSSRCLPSTRWTDNTREALKGLPLASETYDGSGTYLSSAHHTYTLRRLYTGLDGREVRVAFESASDTYSYDDAPFVAGAKTVSLQDVSVDLEGGTPGAGYSAPVTVLTIRGAAEAHIQTSAAMDLFGNSTQETSFGCVDCVPADTSISSHSVPEVVPGDPGGWLWRSGETWVDGPSGKLKDTFVTYDLAGSPLTTSGVLAGTLPLNRFHAVAGSEVAPPPANASSDGTVLLSTLTYDVFGNLVLAVAPNDRCRAVSPTADYADLPLTETIYAGAVDGTCGSTLLTTEAMYNRAFQVVVQAIDLHGEVTVAGYDTFGRMTSLTKPDPASVGFPSALPTTLISYYLPDETLGPFSAILTQTQDGTDPSVAQYRSTWTYADGMGRAIVKVDQADPAAGDLSPWIASGIVTYDAKGAVEQSYLPFFWSGTPNRTDFPVAPTSEFATQVYDSFGRVAQAYGLDQVQSVQNYYHPLSIDAWDGEDLSAAGQHYGTFVTSRKDGHGRVVSTIERVRTNGALELHDAQTTYLPTGWVSMLRRTRNQGDDVVRWMQYDTLGRLVLNAEPNTSVGFTPTVGDTAGLVAWTYAYDDNGDLVGTSDARGCGSNYAYDAAGRIVGADYSPCLASHAPYSAPDWSTGDGTEVFYSYDKPDALLEEHGGFHQGTGNNIPDGDCVIDPTLLVGRVVAISDRASRTTMGYDGRGRTVCMAKQVSPPGPPAVALEFRYAPRIYAQNVTFDALDRTVTASTGAQAVLDPHGRSVVTTTYSRRNVVSSVTSGYGDLIASITRAADGPIDMVTYGDLAGTSTTFTYDARRRVQTVQTKRGPPATWPPSGAPSVYQELLEIGVFQYDLADNPTLIADNRTSSEWPAGAQPVSRSIQYDDLYRATAIAYASPAGPDTWVDPFQAEDNDLTSDPRLAQPSPHAFFTNRAQSQTVAYDWLGNTTSTQDDVGGFYDRSLGTITNGTTNAGPYQLASAAGGNAPTNGSLAAIYDPAGSLSGLSVMRPNALCVPAGQSCSQRFAYDWDEVGRLAQARRWDGAGLGSPSSPVPTSTPAVDLQYAYDASDDRVLKTATDPNGNQLATVYVYDDLELRRAAFSGGDYEDSTQTEVPYLFAHGVRLARVQYATVDPVLMASGTTHVVLELKDDLGSATIAIDQATSELVERSAYLVYGGADSDYRPVGWGSFREDYRFTGKEEDVEVGLDYFGKRFYAPLLGRWISADPLAVHSPGQADSNVYAYVHGRLLGAVDPLGLQESARAMHIIETRDDAVRRGDRKTVAAIDEANGWVAAGAVAVAAPEMTASVAGPVEAGVSRWVASRIGQGLWSRIAGSAAGAVVAGAVQRGGATLITGGSVTDALKEAVKPSGVAKDALIGGVAVTLSVLVRLAAVPNSANARLAVALQARAQDLEASRGFSGGTTAVMFARNTVTGEARTLVATEGRYMPNTFKLRAGEEWVRGDGHAEETILSSLGKNWEVLAGGSSRNVCMGVCEPQLRAAGLTLGGAPFPAQLVGVAKTAFRTFWRDQ